MPNGPYRASAYAGRGMSFSRRARCEEAIADLTQSLRIDPNPPKHEVEVGIHFHLGRCLLMEGHRQQAKDHLLIACKIGDQRFCRALQSPRLKNLK